MANFEYCNELKKRVSPSKWVGTPEYMLITRLEMTCGGGMGGSRWYEYVARLKQIPSNEMIKVHRYDGKDIYINTSYVVSAENFTLGKAELDITKWKYYHTPNVNNETVIETQYVLLDDGMELTLL